MAHQIRNFSQWALMNGASNTSKPTLLSCWGPVYANIKLWGFEKFHVARWQLRLGQACSGAHLIQLLKASKAFLMGWYCEHWWQRAKRKCSSTSIECSQRSLWCLNTRYRDTQPPKCWATDKMCNSPPAHIQMKLRAVCVCLIYDCSLLDFEL